MITDFIFLRETSGYVRDLDVVANATESAALYLQLNTGEPIDKCREFILRTISKEGSHPLKSVPMYVLRRDANQDRIKSIISLDAVLKGVIKTDSVLAPNTVVYDPASKQESVTAKYAGFKMDSRKILKAKGFKALMTKDIGTFQFYANEEGNTKVLTNSISGAHASDHNPHYNKTAHSALTSLGRVATSYSNATTEKFISGNRHYYSVNIVIENILAICKNTNYTELQLIVHQYNLHIPTVNEVLEVISRSTEFYYNDRVTDQRIENLVNKLNDLQRVTFVYTADFYHLAKFNDELIRNFITEMIAVPEPYDIPDIDMVVKGADSDTVALVGIMCANILRGEDVATMRANSEADYILYASTILNVYKVLHTYRPLLIALMATDNQPSSIYEFPVSIRRCVVGSDTDSTMFSSQIWVEWYFGSLQFGNIADKVANVIGFLNSHVISHMLAIASRQMGVEDKWLFRLKMKNEYAFPVYLRANRAKHYATLISAREGNVFLKPKIDIKGVALKDSKVPKAIMAGLEREINNVMVRILANKGVDVHQVIQRIANLEHEIYRSLTAGEVQYLSFINISAKENYKNPMSSNYIYYDLWVKVFEQRYGRIEPPPYPCVKLSVTLDNKQALRNYIASLDPVTSALFSEWATEYISYEDSIHKMTGKITKKKKITGNKSKFAMFILPRHVFEGGIPLEFTNVIDKRSIIAQLTAGHYILLEMLGLYYKNRKNTILLSDDVMYHPDAGLPGDIIEP